MAPTTTPTAPPTTAAPATTTTAPITDATTADPKALAAQLQAVLDRYQELYLESRSDPERPFTDEKLIADFREVAQQHELARLLQWWNEKRAEGSASRPGPTPDPGPYLTVLTNVAPTEVTATYCIFDDWVSYVKTTGAVLDDSVAVTHGVVTFVEAGSGWMISAKRAASADEVPAGSPNPCPAERIS
ncbi:MAG TPA: hypothetical protein VKD67_05820 [Acidimicrobiales bacterium]|nr:hypothetical protein [Acidimicrobiales bacterium]